MVLQLVSERVGEFGLPLHHLTEKGGQDFGQDNENIGIEARCGCQSRSNSGAVHHGQALLRLQLKWLVPADHPQRLYGRYCLPFLGHCLGVWTRCEKTCGSKIFSNLFHSLLGSPMGSGSEAGGDTINIRPLHDLRDHPVGALVHSALGNCGIQRHKHLESASNCGHVSNSQTHAFQANLGGLVESLDVSLHLLKMTPFHCLGSSTPVQRIIITTSLHYHWSCESWRLKRWQSQLPHKTSVSMLQVRDGED